MEINIKRDNLLNRMVKIFVPLLLSNLLNVSIYMINSIWIGRLIGENGISIIANSYPITMIASSIMSGPITAIAVLISQNYGADEKEKVKQIMGVFYIANIILGILVTLIMLLLLPMLLGLLHTPSIILKDISIYIFLYLIGYTVNFLFLTICEALRAIEKTKIPMLFIAVELTINSLVVPILILIGLGIAGAAIGNIIATVIVTVGIIVYINKNEELLKINKKYLRLDVIYLKKILKIGIPITLELWLVSALITIETYISNRSGILGSATYGVVGRLEQIFFVISQPLQTVSTILIGQYIGKKDIESIKSILHRGFELIILPSAFILIIVFILPKQFSKIFVNSKDILDSTAAYLSIVGVAYVLMPARLFLNGFMIGTSYTHYHFIASLIASSLEVVMIFTLILYYQIENLTALGIGVVTYIAVDMILNICFYYSKCWIKGYD